MIAGKAAAFQEALSPDFKRYQQQVLDNAQAMVKVFLERRYTIVSGGTHNHLCLIDLQNREITGKDAERLLESVGITCNKNTVPNDPRSPFVTSGLRIGTPAITTRGFDVEDSEQLAHWMCDILDKPTDQAVLDTVKASVRALCKKRPVYQGKK